MKKYLTIIALLPLSLCLSIAASAQTIVNGVPWYDQNKKPVSAHGANIIFDGGKYYLFGEYKTDSANVFTGFSCYSSDNLSDWHFEGIAFSQQKDGRMGPGRVGERPKVLRCPKTGEYVMLMHTDNLQYKDPCTCYATSRSITGPYEFQGPILYKGQPVKKWDIGSFMDDDERGYLLVHHGMIYRLAEDFHSLDSCLMNSVKGSGESPAMMKKDGIYYWMSSHTTSWERNDNMYWTATSLGGPWAYRGEFCPVGSLTWNSQCSFLLPLDDGRWMYMGDRWSFPRQHQAATYVWLPVEAKDGVLSIPEYMESWDVTTGKSVNLPLITIAKGKMLSKPGDTLHVEFEGTCVGLKGNTDDNSGYAEIAIFDKERQVVLQTSIDFYSKAPATGLRWLSPVLPKGKYTLQVRCSEMKPNWTDKKRIIYGSKGHKVEICEVVLPQTKAANPILPGFNPDPSICAVNGDYYLVTSSFVFVPGLPVYHSRDLVNWELISHGIDRQNSNQFHFENLNDNDDIWAPTIRYHDGLFYIVCTMHKSGGNFFITAKDPRGPWSDPVWIPGTQGIDPTLFWDDDGRCYYIGNRYDFKQQWQGQVGVWMQEIDLNSAQLLGKPTMLTYGHANNARYGEGPHIYKIGKTYYLLMAEGGSGKNHAVTIHSSDRLTGPYKAQQVNPVLSHRQMGNTYPIQNIGHADIFRAADGNLYAVCLGNRTLKDDDNKWHSPLGRETFLVRVEQQDGQIIFAPGVGYVETEIERPNLPWHPFRLQAEPWYGLRGLPQSTTPTSIALQPEVLDSLTTPACLLQKLHGFQWTFSREVTFSTKRDNEWAGITLYRTANSYYTLMKGIDCIRLTKREKGQSTIVAELPFKEKTVHLSIEADSMRLRFMVNGQAIAPAQPMRPLCDDGKYNKFNGLGVGIYATSMSRKSKTIATFK